MPFYYDGKATGINAMYDNKGNLTGYIQSGRQPACVYRFLRNYARCPVGVGSQFCTPATAPTCPTRTTSTYIPRTISQTGGPVCVCQQDSPPQF